VGQPVPGLTLCLTGPRLIVATPEKFGIRGCGHWHANRRGRAAVADGLVFGDLPCRLGS
jgi:hypothetical protein